MKPIHYTATHAYYDGVLLFEARDSGGGYYLAVSIERDETQDRYLLKEIPLEALRRFRTGRTDLKSLLLESPGVDWYVAAFADDPDEPLQLEPRSTPLRETDYLPGSGLVLHRRPSEDELVETARRENTLVVEVSADAPRAATEHRVGERTLAGILSRFRAMVRHSHRRATELDSGLWLPGGELLEILVPADPGSSRVLLASTHSTDMVGSSFLRPAFKHLDAVFEQAEDPDRAAAHLRENRGHFAGATLKLLRFLNDQGAGLRYAWANQHSDDSRHLGVSHAAAARIVEACTTVPEIEQTCVPGEDAPTRTVVSHEAVSD